MRATSSRSLISRSIRSVWVSMTAWNWRTSAGFNERAGSRRVETAPFTAARGVLSSWLTMARNSARSLSCSSSGVMSWSTATKDSISPSAERMGVALSSALTLRPSGTRSTISSARIVSLSPRARAMDISSREISVPSARVTVMTSRSCSGGWSGSRRPSTILLISMLKERGAPVLPSKTATPTGEVSTSVSRSALARSSSRYRRALAMTSAAWDANVTRVSSSSRLNSPPVSLSATKMWPTRLPRWRTGAASRGSEGPTSTGGWRSGRPWDVMYPSMSRSRRGPSVAVSSSKNRIPSARSHIPWDSSAVSPDDRKSSICPESSSRTKAP